VRRAGEAEEDGAQRPTCTVFSSASKREHSCTSLFTASSLSTPKRTAAAAWHGCGDVKSKPHTHDLGICTPSVQLTMAGTCLAGPPVDSTIRLVVPNSMAIFLRKVAAVCRSRLLSSMRRSSAVACCSVGWVAHDGMERSACQAAF
jgi:hypothetical protein